MLYKYFPPHRARIFVDGKIRFSQPCALNDPFESEYLIETRNDIIPRAMRAHEARMREIFAEHDADLAAPHVREQYDQAIQSARLYMESKSSPETVGRDFARQINQRQGVLSLSRTNSNLLMWSHYTESHRGFVLGLDESHYFFHETDRMGLKRPPRNVVYGVNRHIVDVAEKEVYEKLMCRKSLDWAYEEEVRQFKAFGTEEECQQFAQEQVHLFDLPFSCIKQVFIGMNASSRLRAAIKTAVRQFHRGVEVYNASVSVEKYELVFQRVVDSQNYEPQSKYWDAALLHDLGTKS